MIGVGARSVHQVGQREAVLGQELVDSAPCAARILFRGLLRVRLPPCIEGVGRAHGHRIRFLRFYRFVCIQGAGVLRGFCEGCRGFSGSAALPRLVLLILVGVHVDLEVRWDVEAYFIGEAGAPCDGYDPHLVHPVDGGAHLPGRAPHEGGDVWHGGPHCPHGCNVGQGQQDVVVVAVGNVLIPGPDEGLEAHGASPNRVG